MQRRERHRWLGFALLPFGLGVVLMWMGAWFALSRMGVGVPGPARFWPLLVALVGLVPILLFTLRRGGAWLMLPGTLVLLNGLFLFPFSVGLLEWRTMSVLWPVFPLIVGLAFLAYWAAGLGRRTSLLVPTAAGLVVGAVGLTLTSTPVAQILRLVGWPAALLVPGAVMLLLGLVLGAVVSGRMVGALGGPRRGA